MPLYKFEEKSPNIPHPQESWVAPTATVIGDVRLEKETSIWFGASLRGDNEPITIKEGSNVQEGVVMHTDPGYPLTVEKNCTIGHQAMLHGCTIKENSLVGMGATILNGAVIGKNSLVGAHALVPEHKTFPEGVLIIGTPAKVARELTQEEIEGLTKSAKGYVNKLKRYQTGLQEI